MSLVHHVCREGPGLESLFLISKSNCAFANYPDEDTCNAALQKLHDSKFQSVRLVSRLRKSSVEGAAGTVAPTGPSGGGGGGGGESKTSTPKEQSDLSPASSPAPGTETKLAAGSRPVADGAGHKDRFFILKSLTVEDLELSVRTGIWATQSHNEKTLSGAFEVK